MGIDTQNQEQVTEKVFGLAAKNRLSSLLGAEAFTDASE